MNRQAASIHATTLSDTPHHTTPSDRVSQRVPHTSPGRVDRIAPHARHVSDANARASHGARLNNPASLQSGERPALAEEAAALPVARWAAAAAAECLRSPP